MRLSTRWFLALTAICGSTGLNAADESKFETASVKKMEFGAIHNSLGPGTVIMRGDPLDLILMAAFEVKGYQIVGPAWLSEDCFEIIAKMPEGAPGDQIPAMLRGLLAERFKLAAHIDRRPRPVYALVVDKGGPKFKEADMNFRRGALNPGQIRFLGGAERQGFKGAVTMTKLAQLLSGRLDRPVQDFTGLTGTYDIDLAWTPDSTIDRGMASAGSGDIRTDLPAAPGATVFTAIRDSLGLKLEPRNEPIEMLIIDHVERVPTEN